LNSVVEDFRKLALTAPKGASVPPIPQAVVNNDTLKFDFTGDNLAGAVFSLIDWRLKAQLIDSMSRIRAILQICYTHRFNVEKDKSWPADLDTLVKSGEMKAEMLINPRFPDQHPGYIYIPPPKNAETAKAATTMALYESVPAGTEKIAVGFVDGHGEAVTAEQFQKLLRASKAP
jgi:hypothetical protein